MAEDLTARIPEPALLFALKLHSGRMADARDLLIVGANADYDRVEDHLHRGESKKLAECMKSVLNVVEDEGFEDSFKGVFRQKNLPILDLDELIQFIQIQLDKIE